MGSCVATPTGHVLRWHFRIMMQPMAMRGAVEKAYSSAPRSAAITTSRPDIFEWLCDRQAVTGNQSQAIGVEGRRDFSVRVRFLPSPALAFSLSLPPSLPSFLRQVQNMVGMRNLPCVCALACVLQKLAVLELPVSLQAYARAQVVEDQRLLGLRYSELPGETGSLDGRPHLSRGVSRIMTSMLALKCRVV